MYSANLGDVMNQEGPIRILEKNANRRGDLFNRLVKDVFHVLGYDPIRVNVHKNGREIDIFGRHRLEPLRHICAECKAKKEPGGGDEINKFIGVLDAERRQTRDKDGPEATVVGYFVSLSGFKSSALEQEASLKDLRLTLLNGNRVVEELMRGRIVVSREEAVDRASRCVSPDVGLELESAELLAHAMGLIWLLYYHRNKERTHFALIHADGHALAESLAEQIVASDKEVGGQLGVLTYLAPPRAKGPSADILAKARQQYLNYLARSCGEIQLDGLPADEQVGSKRLRLESLFVPLHLVAIKLEPVDPPSEGGSDSTLGEEPIRAKAAIHRGQAALGFRMLRRPARKGWIDREEEKPGDDARQPVGGVLARTWRMAILAAPGGGKSTLLKRLAVAYAFPERRTASADALPERDWFPVFVRCRDLGAMVREPILKVLLNIGERAEMEPELGEAFSALVCDSLRNGTALLLIDGLDEITDDGDRVAFASALRSFLGTYATVPLVVTSREAGFRVVAGALRPECEPFRVADFGPEEVRSLVSRWHREVYGESVEGGKAAEDLARTILENDRIRRLAGNPLLLTTLLLVKRWVGQLPTKRTVLYDKAIEVLLMTWNVQAHAPIDREEALPRLEFVAFSMMKKGLQSISEPRLRELLKQARNELPEVLGYSRLSDSEFIKRIELRSSLLVQSGHTVQDGRLVPIYEFRHLTFQEYLVARAIVDGYYGGRKEGETPAVVIAPYLGRAAWREIVPLTAVLAGREAKEILIELITRTRGAAAKSQAKSGPLPGDRLEAYTLLLGQCLLDEVQLLPTILDSALEAVGRGTRGRGWRDPTERNIRSLALSKFGDRLEEVVKDGLRACDEDAGRFGTVLANITVKRLGWGEDELLKGTARVGDLRSLLSSSEPMDQAAGALVVMEHAFSRGEEEGEVKSALVEIGDFVPPLLMSPHAFVQFAGSWALAWLGLHCGWGPSRKPEVLMLLARLWGGAENRRVHRQAAWATCAFPIVPRAAVPPSRPDKETLDVILSAVSEPGESDWPRQVSQAAITLAYYLGAPWSDSELAERVASAVGRRAGHRHADWAVGILRNLGRVGAATLRKFRPDE